MTALEQGITSIALLRLHHTIGRIRAIQHDEPHDSSAETLARLRQLYRKHGQKMTDIYQRDTAINGINTADEHIAPAQARQAVSDVLSDTEHLACQLENC